MHQKAAQNTNTGATECTLLRKLPFVKYWFWNAVHMHVAQCNLLIYCCRYDLIYWTIFVAYQSHFSYRATPLTFSNRKEIMSILVKITDRLSRNKTKFEWIKLCNIVLLPPHGKQSTDSVKDTLQDIWTVSFFKDRIRKYMAHLFLYFLPTNTNKTHKR